MSSVVHTSAAAEDDLAEIWLYSFKEWGTARADQYIDELCAAIEQLAGHPELGARRDELRPGYRCLRVNRHLVFYTVSPEQVWIVRVLHGRRDAQQHLT